MCVLRQHCFCDEGTIYSLEMHYFFGAVGSTIPHSRQQVRLLASRE